MAGITHTPWNPDYKPQSQAESRLKYCTFREFKLIDDRLYKQPDSKFPNPQYIILESEAFDVNANQHLQLLHTRRVKTWDVIQ